MNVLDLFCGCGGFSYGFEKAGFKVKYAIDNWKKCRETFEYNHPNSEFILGDITELDPNDFADVDIVIGSPPCQKFSTANTNRDEKLGMILVNQFIHWIKVIKPKKWIMENVPPVRKHLSDWVYPEIAVLNCADYGVAQTRKRVFAGDYKIPEPTHNGTWITVQEALHDSIIPNRVEVCNSRSVNNKANHPNNRLDEPNQCITCSPPQFVQKYTDAITNEEYSVDEPSRVIRSNPLKWLDGEPLRQKSGGQASFAKLRMFTVREMATIQSFPKSFEFIGSKTACHKMIGNAVPPLMAQRLAECILEPREESGGFCMI